MNTEYGGKIVMESRREIEAVQGALQIALESDECSQAEEEAAARMIDLLEVMYLGW